MPTNAVALSRLLLAERPSLLRLAQRIVGSWPAAEDVTQSLWFRVQRIEDDPLILNKRAYLFRLASNLATDRRRAEARYGELIDMTAALPEHVAADLVSADRSMVVACDLPGLNARRVSRSRSGGGGAAQARRAAP